MVYPDLPFGYAANELIMERVYLLNKLSTALAMRAKIQSMECSVLNSGKLEIPEAIILIKANDPERQSFLEKERLPYLVPGFSIKEYREIPQFLFSATVNCHHSMFVHVLLGLVGISYDSIMLSVGDYNKLNDLPGSFSKEKINILLSRYSEEIAKNVELQMLINSQSGESAVQIFASDSKFFEVYGADEFAFRSLMDSLDLPEVNDLATLDEFPRTMVGEPGEITQKLLSDIGVIAGRI